MASRGELAPRPDVAIFADTQWEPPHVYAHLDWLEAEIDIPVERITAGDLRSNTQAARTISGHSFVEIPLYTIERGGGKGLMRRQCTSQYKISPIYRHVRRLLGVEPGKRFPTDIRVEMQLGLSTDETFRMRPARTKWVTNTYPLIDAGMSRSDCLEWHQRHYQQRQLRRSSCVICPYHDDAHWRQMRDSDPESYAEAVEFDASLRAETPSALTRQIGDRKAFIHPSRTPLDDAISNPAQPSFDDFMSECDGVCGV